MWHSKAVDACTRWTSRPEIWRSLLSDIVGLLRRAKSTRALGGAPLASFYQALDVVEITLKGDHQIGDERLGLQGADRNPPPAQCAELVGQLVTHSNEV